MVFVRGKGKTKAGGWGREEAAADKRTSYFFNPSSDPSI